MQSLPAAQSQKLFLFTGFAETSRSHESAGQQIRRRSGLHKVDTVLLGDLKDTRHVRTTGLCEFLGAPGEEGFKSGGCSRDEHTQRAVTHILKRVNRAVRHKCR